MVGRPIQLGGAPSAVAAGEGSVWVSNAGDGTVQRIDPDAQSFDGDPIDVGGAPAGVAVGGGSVWVTLSADDRLVRIEP
jgi:DNA-binding beta-propeller fold protein YncE